ncbi:MAG TPA: quinone-dependent dihydroorotate dehydrogenase, partial [Blastocatellia bacterium]
KAHLRTLARLAKWRFGAGLAESLLSISETRIQSRVFGLDFRNPVGLAAGLDKNGEACRAWESLGFGFFEIGTVTPRPQPGNPRPRIFRLVNDRALINRMGFNGIGAAAVSTSLAQLPALRIPMGINVGKNKDTPFEDSAADYIEAIRLLEGHGDYLVLNVSSPNTPGLRDLQRPAVIKSLVEQSAKFASSQTNRLPVLVKIAPDLEDCEFEDTIDAIVEGGASGLIATNTTIKREGLSHSILAQEQGGLSGAPLHKLAVQTVRRIFEHLQGRVAIIGVGGIFDAAGAFELLSAGASLVQIYTGLIYEGPTLARRINTDLLKIMKRNGFHSLGEIVGRGCA